MEINKLVNLYLNNQRLPKYEFDDLKLILEEVKNLRDKKRKRIFDWFRFLQSIEIVGWRPKAMTYQIIRVLSQNSKTRKILFYALFCPSYKKRKGAFGFRTDDIGETTKAGIKNLMEMWKKTQKLGFCCESPLAIFFDIAIEQAEKVLESNGLRDLDVNIKNLKSSLPQKVRFIKLSQLSKKLFTEVGYKGVIENPPPIPQFTFKRIVERGKKFYQLFGWTDDQIVERSKIIATSEAMTGEYLKRKFSTGIMIYTPTMLERGAVYSGMNFNTNPLPIIFPRKEKGS